MAVVEIVVLTRKNTKNGTFATAHTCIYLSSAWLLATHEIIKALKEDVWVLK